MTDKKLNQLLDEVVYWAKEDGRNNVEKVKLASQCSSKELKGARMALLSYVNKK